MEPRRWETQIDDVYPGDADLIQSSGSSHEVLAATGKALAGTKFIDDWYLSSIKNPMGGYATGTKPHVFTNGVTISYLTSVNPARYNQDRFQCGGKGLFDLGRKCAVVTGAASGIGFAIATLFVSSGARVAFLDLNQEKTADAAAQTSDSENARAFSCDVSNETSVKSAFTAIQAWAGRVDLLVNCAGIAHIGNLATTTPEDLDRLYAVNVRGVFLVMQAALGTMGDGKGGAIVNLASIAATSGLSDRFAYSMTKGAVKAMTLSVARDYIAQGIRCNCISPARVHTPFVDGFLARSYPGREAEKMKELAAAQPIGRMGTPAEIAKLALYLCSDDASFVTGADYAIDGGYLSVR